MRAVQEVGVRSVALGAHIRRLRGELGLSLVSVGKLAAFSKSSLQRIELGERVVTPDEVAQLETSLGLGGRLAVEYYREVLAARNLTPRPLWVHAFPASWSGTVWAHIRPPVGTREVSVSLAWGSWSRTCDAQTPDDAITVVFGKGSDGESIPISVSVEPECSVHFGFGPPVSAKFLDVNDGWEYNANESEALRRVGAAFQAMLRRRGRSIADLAELLGTSEHEVRTVLQLIERNE